MPDPDLPPSLDFAADQFGPGSPIPLDRLPMLATLLPPGEKPGWQRH